MKKAFWFALGILLLVIAYIGLVLPGIPWSAPTVGAAYCFAKSNDKFHNWLYQHRLFGPFLRNWNEKRVFPTRMKYVMVVTMLVSLSVLWFTTANIVLISWCGGLMALSAVWSWRYPGSVEEHDRRVKQGERIAWLR